MNSKEVKKIPYCYPLVINRDGEVFNSITKKQIKVTANRKSIRVKLLSGDITTRTISGLLEATWGKDANNT